MKKIFMLFLSILFFFLPGGSALAADVEIANFFDTSTIAEDLSNLGLDSNNYLVSIDDAKYDHINVIAIAEATNEDYIYVYTINPYVYSSKHVLYVDLEFNSSGVSRYNVTMVSIDNTITKYKMKFNAYETSKRKYVIENIVIKHSTGVYTQEENFIQSFEDRDNLVETNFDSYLLLKENDYEVFSIFVEPDFSFWGKIFDIGFGIEKPQLFFYNFNTSIDYEDILEVDFIYTINEINYSDLAPFGIGGVSFSIFVNDYSNYDVESKLHAEYTLDSPQTILKYDEQGNINSYIYNKFGSNINEDYISLETNKRTFDNSSTYEQLKETDFYNYKYSIMFDCLEYSDSMVASPGFIDIDYKFYKVEDKVSMTRLKYMIEGVTYVARVNDGEGKSPIDVLVSNPNLLLYIVLAVISVVIIIMIINKIVGITIDALFKGIWKIITWPFKMIFKLLKWAIKKIKELISFSVHKAIPNIGKGIWKAICFVARIFAKVIKTIITIVTWPFRALIKLINK